MSLDKELLQQGLYFLSYCAQYSKKSEYSNPFSLVDGHPFGLALPINNAGGGNSSLVMYDFYGYPGNTEASVCNFIKNCASNCAGNTPVLYIREIFCETGTPGQHDVFFEIGYHRRVIMCGGCTDCSGEGGIGRKNVEAVLALLSHIYGVEVIKVIIPYPQSAGLKRKVEEIVDSFLVHR